ncbi:monovalent cation/H(+) antiporter subunit G [Halopenitus persicus]|uniref:Multisubunit sodium/proton antiporter, MrpG subunit n=1 Tax=Halopenitus persicus TaxID=1048396 RepID=A0A1H3HEQ6_9EURY|nr:monovalent cation/H(+) antiporter subunit G [Halopenitus persicus]SDY13952.1 multisubunit sodium/proton antiporter, MrpG subunit [Halopenitus persicus]
MALDALDPITAARVVLVLALLAGALFFTFVSMTGVIRLPDVYARAHTASQADTLGAGFGLAAVALTLGWQGASVKTAILLFFVFVTNPTAAHAVARAAFEDGNVPWTEGDERR